MLDIEKFADRGKSLARKDGYIVFVTGAVPGDRVRARVKKRKKNYAEAHLIEVVTPSRLRTEPKCFYFGTCGGCKWQHVNYAAQLNAKKQSVQEALVHHGGLSSVDVRPTIGATRLYHYRNKMEFSFSTKRWLTKDEIKTGDTFTKNFALGLHVPGYFDKVIDLQECFLQSEFSVSLVNQVRDFVRAREWQAWDIRNHTGYLRHLVIRLGERTGEIMVNLVTNGFKKDRITEFATFLETTFPDITTFVNTINTGVAQTSYGEQIHTLYGPGVIRDRIGNFVFEIGPNTFFQTNTTQTERLYEIVRDFADVQAEDLVYDLYCGAGTISVFIANQVKNVVGVELVEEAVHNARTNAAANRITNCTFLSGDLMHTFTPDFVRTHGKPDVLIVDPPRAGLHKKVVRQINDLRPERFVYVSCNPQTQARDLVLMRDVYHVEAAQPVDLFPHTHHTESVLKLRLK